MEDFNGKLAVITGAASGIGKALAMQCVTEGMKVALVDVDADKLFSVVDELSERGANVFAQPFDVSEETPMQNFAEACRSELGPVDLLFNNAGILRVGQCWGHSYQEWKTILSINVLGVVNGLNAFVPTMISGGRPGHIVNTGSVGSLVAAAGMAQYTACKMAVRGITESLAFDLAAAGANIDVSLLCPGPVLTSMADALHDIDIGNDGRKPDEHLMAGELRYITPEECAAVVFEAIRQRRFWIFTHPFQRYYKKKTDDILNDINPVYENVEFD